MSRCGSCELYCSKKYWVRCDGNCDVEECADNLQTLVDILQKENEKLKKDTVK